MRKFPKKLMLLFILITSLTVLAWAEIEKSKPAISSEQTFWDFGFVPFDYELVHFYEIKNSGEENLFITHIGSSCDCTSARAKDTMITPGSSTKVRVTFSTKDYYGKTTRTLAVSSNDPDNPVFNLEFVSLIGALPKFVEAQPNALFFLPPHKDKAIKLLNKSDSDIDVKISLEPDSIFAISYTELEIESGSSATLKVTPRPDLKAGTFHSSFLIEFGTKPSVKVTIPVKIVRY